METFNNRITPSIKWGLPTPPQTPTNGGKVAAKRFNAPTYARFRAKVQYEYKSAYYYSYDYIPRFNKGVKVGKDKSEMRGLDKLLEMLNKKFARFRYAVIYVNVSNDLSTATGRYDLHLCNVSARGAITWKTAPIWRADNPQMLDVSRLREKLNEQNNLKNLNHGE